MPSPATGYGMLATVIMTLAQEQLASITAQIESAAESHLHARDAETALSHFTDDVIAISNLQVFPSRMLLEEDVRKFYGILDEVLEAAWQDPRVIVIDERSAVFTAGFRYGFRSKDGDTTHLEGVWSALFRRQNRDWKIRLRHESFMQR